VIEDPSPGRRPGTASEEPDMLLVECPLCATPAACDTDDDELDCATCNVRLGFAADDRGVELPLVA
jgi:hypothetical protein